MEASVHAVLFPFFMQVVGVGVHYILSHYAEGIPYTAVMFIIGVLVGVVVELVPENAFTFSAETWVGINGEALLLIFLPGLSFLDAYKIDVPLFRKAFWQMVIFAFPAVLIEMVLAALVAFYVFPYGWSFNFCMLFGAILAANDPVHISEQLKELGAPPRLMMHLSGESLLNDASVVVFFLIFSERFFYEFGIPGIGGDAGWVEGFLQFFRFAFGGACFGIVFGVVTLIILYSLNRRLSGEDATVQVVASISCAYLSYYTSEIVFDCAGLVAVVVSALVIKAFGEQYYNDYSLSMHFWEITAYLLDTLLFSLGGCVWGSLLTKSYLDEYDYTMTSSDWSYLGILFLSLTAIRFFSIFVFYPITKRLGVGTNLQETVFLSYGGFLKGSVGIALALALFSETKHLTHGIEDEATRIQFSNDTHKLFCMVGGVTVLTLLIVAPFGEKVLKLLGLITPSDARRKVLENFEKHMHSFTLEEYVDMMTQDRFDVVDFSFLRVNVPALKEVTYEQLQVVVKRHQDACSQPTVGFHDACKLEEDDVESKEAELSKRRLFKTVFNLKVAFTEDDILEERMMFLRLLGNAYDHFMEPMVGEMEPRSFVALTLTTALQSSIDNVTENRPMSTWNSVEMAKDSWIGPVQAILALAGGRHKQSNNGGILSVCNSKVRQIMVFVEAHKRARKKFKDEFNQIDGSLTATEKIVLDECDENIRMAKATLTTFHSADVKLTKSQYVAQILLNKGAQYYRNLVEHGLMSEGEAGEVLEEIQELLFEVWDSHGEDENEMAKSTITPDEKTRLLS